MIVEIDNIESIKDYSNNFDALSKYMNYIRAVGLEILIPYKCLCGSYQFRMEKKKDTALFICKKCNKKKYIQRDNWKNYKVDRRGV